MDENKKEYSCAACGSNFASQEELDAHNKEMHPEEDSDQKETNDEENMNSGA